MTVYVEAQADTLPAQDRTVEDRIEEARHLARERNETASAVLMEHVREARALYEVSHRNLVRLAQKTTDDDLRSSREHARSVECARELNGWEGALIEWATRGEHAMQDLADLRERRAS